MTVMRGTAAVATACTILDPSFVIPPCSYRFPTMKPVMFCRNRSGMRRCEQSSTKCAPLRALSLNSTPEFATMPTGYPYRRPNPHTSVVP